MGLLIEIGLTIAAWRRGWGWWALIPCGLAFFISFFAGMVIGLFGGTVENAMPLFLLLDLACIVALIVMVAKPLEVDTGAVSEIRSMPACRADEIRY